MEPIPVDTVDRFTRTGLAVALATAGAYLVWLGWHTLEDADAYAEWRVAGLVLTWSSIVVVGVWRASPTATALSAVLSLVLVWSFDAASTPADDANLWPIGAIALLIGSTVGAAVLTGVTAATRAVVRHRSTAAGRG